MKILIFDYFYLAYESDDMGAYSVSFPRDFNYGPEDGDGDNAVAMPEHKPRILLMGLRR